MEYIKIGKIINTHGLKGEMKIKSYSDFDEERYQKGNTVYVLHEGKYEEKIIHSYRVHKGFPLITFKEELHINYIEKYKTDDIYILATSRPKLDKGKFYYDELIGLEVQDEEENVIGEVIAVEETSGANRNLRVEKEDGTTVLIPYVPAFIEEVDIEAEVIVVKVVDGLL